MAALMRDQPDRTAATTDAPQFVRLRGRADLGAALLTGAGLAVVVGRDGSYGWQVVRVVVVVCLAILTVWAMTVLPRRQRALTMTVLGLAAVPVGVGIGVPHLLKSGPRLLTVAGSAVLAGGVVLLVSGAIALVRTITHWSRRAPAMAAVLASCFLLTWSLGQAVAATNTPRPTVGSTSPGDRGLAYRDVTFPSSDGVTLSGWYVPSRTGAAVVLLHGAGSTRSNVLSHAVVLARHGYGVLLYDARGHGRSNGRAMDFGWYGDNDIAGAVSFLQRQDDVDPARIGAVGMSMGGEQAIGAAAAMSSIKVVVAEGATNRVAGDRAWMSDEFGWRGSLTEGLEALTYGFTDLLTDAHPPITLHDAVAAAAPRPVLLIAAGDAPDEARADRYVQSAAPDTVELWVAVGTTHTNAFDTHPAEWEARVSAFLDRALGIDEGAPSP
jgi:dienelactone hydrolase